MSDFFKDLIAARRVVSRTIQFAGKEKTVFFRELTAGERSAISRGQRVRLRTERNDDAASEADDKVMEVDAGEIMQRTQRFLSFCVVDEKGANVFRNEKDVAALPESLVQALQAAAQDALSEFGQTETPEEVGN